MDRERLLLRAARWVLLLALAAPTACGGDDVEQAERRCLQCSDQGLACMQYFDGDCRSNTVQCAQLGTPCGGRYTPSAAPCGDEIDGAVHCYGP